jgi:hypothetical protein
MMSSINDPVSHIKPAYITETDPDIETINLSLLSF